MHNPANPPPPGDESTRVDYVTMKLPRVIAETLGQVAAMEAESAVAMGATSQWTDIMHACRLALAAPPGGPPETSTIAVGCITLLRELADALTEWHNGVNQLPDERLSPASAESKASRLALKIRRFLDGVPTPSVSVPETIDMIQRLVPEHNRASVANRLDILVRALMHAPVAAPSGGGRETGTAEFRLKDDGTHEIVGVKLTEAESANAQRFYRLLHEANDPYALDRTIEAFIAQRAASPLPAVATPEPVAWTKEALIEALGDAISFQHDWREECSCEEEGGGAGCWYRLTREEKNATRLSFIAERLLEAMPRAAAAPEAPGIPASAVLEEIESVTLGPPFSPEGTAPETCRAYLVRADRVSILPDPPQEG